MRFLKTSTLKLIVLDFLCLRFQSPIDLIQSLYEYHAFFGTFRAKTHWEKETSNGNTFRSTDFLNAFRSVPFLKVEECVLKALQKVFNVPWNVNYNSQGNLNIDYRVNNPPFFCFKNSKISVMNTMIFLKKLYQNKCWDVTNKTTPVLWSTLDS